tara:strand:- start:619 stop:1020 length:402 start_codon:yes stop_codon:yes gene_type:complete
MSQKDLNKIAKIEKAIAKKFGQEAIINPKSKWDDEKEKDYLQQLKEFYSKKRKKADNNEKINEEGFLLSKNLINKESKRVCTACSEYSFNIKDDLYMNKFDCCWKCYIQWVEDREERWLNGWRPNNEINKNKT